MRRSFVALAWLCWGTGTWAGSSADAATLEDKVRAVIRKYGYGKKHVAVAVSPPRRRVVVALNADTPFKPASNQKLLTSAAALYWLGPDYEFETTLSSTAPPRAGTIAGDLILRGTGDPNISGRFYDPSAGPPRQDSSTHLLRTWARKLRKAGIQRIDGDLVVDDSFFDQERFLPTWRRAQEGRWYSAQISSLSFNDNCIEIRVRPGARPGAPAVMDVTPACFPFVTIKGNPRTSPGKKANVLLHRKTGTNVITAGGDIGVKSPETLYYVAIDDPAMFFGHAMRETLRSERVKLMGTVAHWRPTDPAGATRWKSLRVPFRGESLLIRHTSTLAVDLPVINKRSQNLHAEIVLKTMGARVVGDGSLSGGEKAVRKYLAAKDINAASLAIADGSGLSHANRLTARLLVEVLKSVQSEPYFREYLASLPVAGRDGTLKSRFRRYPQLHGQVFAKTGTIAGVWCLGGYIAKDGATWSFAILVNGAGRKSRSANELHEEICWTVFRSI